MNSSTSVENLDVGNPDVLYYPPDTPIKHSIYETLGDLFTEGTQRELENFIKHEEDVEKVRYMRKFCFDKFVKSKVKSNTNLTTICKEMGSSTTVKYLQSMGMFSSTVLDGRETSIPFFDPCYLKALNSTSCNLTGFFIDILIRRIICEIREEPFSDRMIRKFCKRLIFGDTGPDLYVEGVGYMDDPKEIDVDAHLNGIKLSRDDPYFKDPETVYNRGTSYTLPSNFKQSYRRVTNKKYKCQDILFGIGVVSISAVMVWRSEIMCDEFDSFYRMLRDCKQHLVDDVVLPLHDYFKRIVGKKSRVLSNPVLTSKFPIPAAFEDMENADTMINAEADLIIDKTLYEIKCCRAYDKDYFFLQMLLYSCMYSCSNGEEKKIQSMAVLDVYRGRVVEYSLVSIDIVWMLHILMLIWPERRPVSMPYSGGSTRRVYREVETPTRGYRGSRFTSRSGSRFTSRFTGRMSKRSYPSR